MKSSKIWKIVWVSGIYIILGIMLYLVVIYKIKWEHKDLNTYLYFYDCNKSLCTSTSSQPNYYNKMICENDECPYINYIINENIILENKNKKWIYNYINNKIISDKYQDYKYIGNNNFIISDKSNNQGIMEMSGNTLVEPEYKYIDDYNNGFISYKENNLYGINTADKKIKVEPEFEHIVLINDKLFAGMKNNKYKIYTYDNINKEDNSQEYDYIYAYKDIIITINNKKLDILTTNLEATLIMKIDTYYEYKIEKERESLDLYYDNEYIYFKIVTSETEYKEYKYNYLTKKLT